MLKVAIAGNIASGKSLVEKFLKNKGYTVYDADDIAHKVLDSITEFYNQDIFTNGKPDRKKLGELVFSHPEFRIKLEELTHPKIKEEINKLFIKHNNEEIVFVSVPLLYEANFEPIFDKVIFIKIDKELQLKRLMKRNNLSEHSALLRINSQIPQDKKINKADFVIDNNSTEEELEKQLLLVLKKIL